MSAKMPETGKSIFKNVLYGFSTWLLPLSLSFVATPIIVRSLGNEDYGIYALILGFIAYSFNFNVGRAVTKYIAEFRANGERDKIREVISATIFINLAIGLIGLTVICLTANWLVTGVFRIEAESQSKTIYALYLSGLIIFFAMLNQVFNSVLQGIQRFDVYSKIFNGYSFLLVFGNLSLALLGFKLLALLIWNLAITILTCAVFLFSAKRLLPEFGFDFRFKRESLKRVLNYSWGIIGYQILANVLLLFERSWITRKMGAESLTFYVVPMMLALYIHGFIASLTMVVFPLASELRNDREKLLSLYLKATKIVCLLTVFLAMTLIVQSSEFLYLWMGSDFAEKSTQLLILHTITFGLTSIGIVSWQLTEGLGYPNYNCFLFVICLIICVTGMIWLTQDFGNNGVAAARLSGFGTVFFSIFFVEKWIFKQVQVKFWLKIIGILTIAAVAGGLTEKFIIASFPVKWIYFVISVIFGGVIYCLILWFLGFVSGEEKLFVKRILSR